MYLESPKLTYHNGYYYLTSAQGGTAGPATSHMVVSARSRNIDGPWENSPWNPIVHTYTDDDSWWSKGHGTIIDDSEGNWWIIYHAYPNDFHTLGRATLIEPVIWTDDGWFHTIPKAEFPKTDKPVKDGMELSDNFTGKELGLQWTLWAENSNDAIAFNGNSIDIIGKGSNPADGRLLLVTPQHRAYTTETEITIGENSTSGLLLYYSDKAFAGICADNNNLFIYSSPSDIKTIPNTIGDHILIRLYNDNNTLSAAVSKDGKNWTDIATGIDVSTFHHNTFLGFYALRPALSVFGSATSRFHNFIYRPIKTR